MKQSRLVKEPPKTFPTNPFPDVDPKDFNKLNKKRVTEDFVSENFRLIGWNVFEPFTDTGIDRVITKRVCPDSHTSLNSSETVCSRCGKHTVNIIRFLQIKTRALKKGIFGFTLKSKDIRIDPRHVYVLYCDTTRDFLIVPIFDYLKFFDNTGSNPFSATSFRKGNQKLNSLKYDEVSGWSWGKYSWEEFRNIKGLERLQNPKIDIDLEKWIRLTRGLSNKLLMTFSAGGTYPLEIENPVKEALLTRIKIFSNKSEAKKVKDHVLEYLQDMIKDAALFESIMKYWETVKNLEIKGGEEEEEV